MRYTMEHSEDRHRGGSGKYWSYTTRDDNLPDYRVGSQEKEKHPGPTKFSIFFKNIHQVPQKHVEKCDMV